MILLALLGMIVSQVIDSLRKIDLHRTGRNGQCGWSTDSYSAENLKITKALSSWQGYNRNVVAEGNEIAKNLDKTSIMKFSKELPVLIFAREGLIPRDDGKTTQSFYEMALSGLNNSQIVMLQGHHYLHWINYIEMSNDVNNFLTTIQPKPLN